jgi:hypothetical protein
MNIIDVSEKAFLESERIFSKAMGLAVDPDIKKYRGLTNDDFEALQNRFGISEVARYIRHMEAKIAKAQQELD